MVSHLQTLMLQIIVADVTTMKTTNFQDDFPSIPINNFKDHYVLVLHLTSMQHATESFNNPELVGESLRLELSFTFPGEHVTGLFFIKRTDVFGCS